jgi:hypothetical protein
MSDPDPLEGIEDWPVIDATGDAVPALASWPDVELCAVGEWPLSTGPANFTSADLAEACAATRCPSVGQPIIKIGHQDPRFDGEPAAGWIGNMRLNETQTKLLGDYTGMPGWLGEILPSAYPARSIEGCWNFTCQTGHVHPFVITAVALLGVVPPGVGTIANLNDVAGLYGVGTPAEPVPADAQAARPFRTLALGAAMPPQTAGTGHPAQAADAAGVVPTVDDIRREYYEEADWSEWIVEVQITSDGPVLIVIDDEHGELRRVPVDLSDPSHVQFGDAVPVLVSYVDAPEPPPDQEGNGNGHHAAAFPPDRTVAAAWGSRAASRQGVVAGAIARHTTPTDTGTWDGSAAQTALPTEEGTATDYRAAYAWVDPDADADTKAAYKFIHHMISSDGTVGDASTVACSAGIGILNGGRGGADIPDADVQGVYSHLAGHLTDADLEPPELNAAAPEPGAEAGAALEDDPDVAGAQRHGSMAGEHEHPHADGAGGTHFHLHTHSGDGRHDHDHAGTPAPTEAGAPAQTEGAADMEFSDDQMAAFRKALGKKDDEEITAAELVDAMGKVTAAPHIDASAPETPVLSDGTYLVDSEIIKGWRDRAAAGDHAVRELAVRERDSVLAAAVSQGKFPQSRLEHYQVMWDKDPDGTRKHVGALAAGLVPMDGPRGSNFTGDPDMPGDFAEQAAYRQLYPEDARTPGIGIRR